MSADSSDRSKDCKVYIGGLGDGAEKGEVNSAFTRYGTLTNLWIARNPPGFAFVEYADYRDAEDAIRALDGTTMNGHKIRVQKSRGKSRLQSAVVSNPSSRPAGPTEPGTSQEQIMNTSPSRPSSKRAKSPPPARVCRQEIRDMYRAWSGSRSRSRSLSRSRHEKRRSRRRSRSRSRSGRRHRSRSSSNSLYSDEYKHIRSKLKYHRTGSRSMSPYTSHGRSRSRSSGRRRRRSCREHQYGSGRHGERNRHTRTSIDRSRQANRDFDIPDDLVDGSAENDEQTLKYNGVDSSPIEANQPQCAVVDLKDSDAGCSKSGKKLWHQSTQTDYYLLLHFVQKAPKKLSETFLRLDRDKVLNATYHPEIVPSIFKKTSIPTKCHATEAPSKPAQSLEGSPSRMHSGYVDPAVDNLPDSTLDGKFHIASSKKSDNSESNSAKESSYQKSQGSDDPDAAKPGATGPRETEYKIELEDNSEPTQQPLGDQSSSKDDANPQNYQSVHVDSIGKRSRMTFAFRKMSRRSPSGSSSVHSKSLVRNRVQDWLSSCSSLSDRRTEDPETANSQEVSVEKASDDAISATS